VTDHGLGIAQHHLKHIFDRFYRVDAARGKKDSGGYGLGLSLAKKIIQAHHGSIRVESELDRGTTFILDLPKA
jgi:two-component system phosphate regulon sensor histidine kinase PhoR